MHLKVELHSHTFGDPEDRIPYTAETLIDRAAALGYHALAITLHNRQGDLMPYQAHARSRNLVLIPGLERTIDGCHVLLLNFSRRAESVGSFEDVKALKQQEAGLVVAPHPFFPLASSLGALMDRHADVFDAVEVNAMYTRSLDFNRKARRWAAEHGKPLVGNGDVHRLGQLGSTYSIVDAEPTPDSIVAAIRGGQVAVETRPLPAWLAGWIFTDMLVAWAGLVDRRPRAARAVLHSAHRLQ
jgi:predicted metal-dependent phosphoesterase TrpH